jgi:hypothetical protein
LTASVNRPPLRQHRLRLRGIVLYPVDHLPRYPRHLRDGGRAGVLREQVLEIPLGLSPLDPVASPHRCRFLDATEGIECVTDSSGAAFRPGMIGT